MKQALIGNLLFALTLAILPAVAQANAAQLTTAEKAAKKKGDRKFAGINFGVGLSTTVDTGSRSRVSEAAIDANGIVRVNMKEDVRARVMLEAHAFLKQWGGGSGATDPPLRGFGPFIALQPGTDEIIEAIGLGVMWGFKRTKDDDAASFNLGVGYVVDPSVQVLGDEFTENMPAPTDPMGMPIPIRFQKRDQGGLLILGSFSWR